MFFASYVAIYGVVLKLVSFVDYIKLIIVVVIVFHIIYHNHYRS